MDCWSSVKELYIAEIHPSRGANRCSKVCTTEEGTSSPSVVLLFPCFSIRVGPGKEAQIPIDARKERRQRTKREKQRIREEDLYSISEVSYKRGLG